MTRAGFSRATIRDRLGPLILLGIVTMFVGAVAHIPFARAGAVTLQSRAEEPQANYFNVQPGVNYVGSKACAPCHKDIYDHFVRTEMGRSMSLPDLPSQLEKVPKPVTVYDKQAGLYFQVIRQGSDLYQSAHRTRAGLRGSGSFQANGEDRLCGGNRGQWV